MANAWVREFGGKRFWLQRCVGENARRTFDELIHSIRSIIVYRLKTFYINLIIPRECQRSSLLLWLFVINLWNMLVAHFHILHDLTWSQLLSRGVTTVACWSQIKKERQSYDHAIRDKAVCWAEICHEVNTIFSYILKSPSPPTVSKNFVPLVTNS